jgi:hydrogenase/urease accessory protein HupE
MTVWQRVLVVLLTAVLLVSTARAHESRPGYLQLTLGDAENVNMLLKLPAVGNMRFGLYPNMPANCTELRPPTKYIVDGAYTERGLFRCDGGITGETVAIDGLSRTLTDVLVRVERADGTTQVTRLTPSAPSFLVVSTPGVFAVAGTYLAIGFEHILLGIDHLLFVLALLILVKGARKLIWTITAFTIAHSITLAAATLGLMQIPQAPVEAVIALSIVFVASEIVHASQGRPGLTQRKPWIVAFTFGLLHGFGFAGALTEVGLPEQAVPIALLFFNVGVELGQLAFIAAVVALTILVRRTIEKVPLRTPAAAAYAIGIVASFWTIQRVAGFWG